MSRQILRSPLRLFAPAKINLGLEVLGRLPYGYHEVVTVLETISIFDIIDLSPSEQLIVDPGNVVSEDGDLIRLALERLRDRCGVDIPLSVTATKHIPIAAGLGGGSSDAGTALIAVGSLLGIKHEVILEIASSIGSDVPFFLRGGVALASGTGTDLKPLVSSSRHWYIVAVPKLEIQSKTAQLYGELRESDFTSGDDTRTTARRLMEGQQIDVSLLHNAFRRPLCDRDEVRDTVKSMQRAGAPFVLPSGAGPAVFTLCLTFQDARELAARVRGDGARVYVATSAGALLNHDRILASTN